MHSFKLKKVFIFFVIVALAINLLIYIGYASDSAQGNIKKELKLKEGEINTLICGASQAAEGINPIILNDDEEIESFNLASNGASLSARLSICKQYIELNPVNTVILDIGEDVLCINDEDFGHQGHHLSIQRMTLKGAIDFFVHDLSFSDKVFVFRDLLKNGKSVIVNNLLAFLNIKKLDYISQNYVGYGFYIGYDNLVKIDENTYKDNYQKLIINDNIISENKQKLIDFIEYCDDKNIELYIVTIPSATAYLNQYTNLDNIYNELEDICSQCHYINYNLLKNKEELFPDETAYYDATHLSTDSSTILTNSLTDMIKKIRNKEDISNLFYSSYKEKLEQTMN